MKKIEDHIGVLDGIRAYSILFVVWYHLWQQNWLTPYINLDHGLFKYLGIKSIPINTYVSYGFVLVDLMVFLSAFCCFLPFAKSIVLKNSKSVDTKTFYIKRAARILPSYYLAVIVSFLFSLAEGRYSDNPNYMWKDLITHLTFTSGIFRSTYIGATKLNPVLWTVEMEVLFYLIIPFIAKYFKRKPILVFSIMLVFGVFSTNLILLAFSDSVFCYVNHPLTFMSVYAIGILSCVIYIYFKKKIKENRVTYLFGTLVSISSMCAGTYVMRLIGGSEDMSVMQLKMRLPLALVNSLFVLGTAFALPLFKKLFDNKLAVLICIISYNLYIWHQRLFYRFVLWRIPGYEGSDNPAWSGDKAWSWKYSIIAVTCSIIAATVVTFFVEKPMHRFILNKFGPVTDTNTIQKEPKNKKKHDK